MSTIRVKIEKIATEPESWYNESVGLLADVYEEDGRYFLYHDKDSCEKRFIRKSDCSIVSEAIQENHTEFKEEQWLWLLKYGIEHLIRFTNLGIVGAVISREVYKINPDSGVVVLDYGSFDKEELTAATPEQIERVLTAVAVSKGFVEDIEYYGCVSAGRDVLCYPLKWYVFENEYPSDRYEALFDKNSHAIYYNGTWAKIVDQDKSNETTLTDLGKKVIESGNETIPLESLPERWAIERTKENYERVNKWASKKFGVSYTENNHYIHDNTGIYAHPMSGYTLITDEQFDKWVLKGYSKQIGKIIDKHVVEPFKKTSTNTASGPYISGIRAYEITMENHIKQQALNNENPIMEDKALSIEEKKKIWFIVKNLLKYNSVKPSLIKFAELVLQDHAPLFHTSIDNVPVWHTERYWTPSNGGEEWTAFENMPMPKVTASTREAAHAYLNDNRVVKESQAVSALHEVLHYAGMTSLEQDLSLIKSFKEELSKLYNQ